VATEKKPLKEKLGINENAREDTAIIPKEVKAALMSLNKIKADPIKQQFGIENYKQVNGMDQDTLKELSDAIDLAKGNK